VKIIVLAALVLTPSHAFGQTSASSNISFTPDYQASAPAQAQVLITFQPDYSVKTSTAILQISFTPDYIPPTMVADLRVNTVYPSSVTLSWTAPSDVGGVSSYDIRYSSDAIDPVSFGSASVVADPPGPLVSGSTQTINIDVPADWASFFAALKSNDSVGNVSALSNVAGFSRSTVTVNGTPELTFYANKPVFSTLVSTSSELWAVAVASAAEQGLVLANNVYQLGPDGDYAPPAVLTFVYSTATLASLGLLEADIAIYEHFSDLGWVKLPDQVLDTVNHAITVPITRIASLFGIFGKRAPDIATVSLEFHPDTINIKHHDDDLNARLEAAGPSSAADINPLSLKITKVNNIRLRHPISVDLEKERHHHDAYKYVKLGDSDHDGIPDLTVRFDWDDLIKVLPANTKVRVTIEGRFRNDEAFAAWDYLRVIEPIHVHGRCRADIRHKNMRFRFPGNAITMDGDYTVVEVAEERESREKARARAADSAGLKRHGSAYEFGPEGAAFDQPVMISLPYDPGTVDTRSTRIDIAYWNEAQSRWEPINSTINKKERLVEAGIRHFSVYQLVTRPIGGYGVSAVAPNEEAAAEESLSVDAAFRLREIYVYPNPAKGPQIPVFHIETGLADSVKLSIYTVSGRLAHEHAIAGAPQPIDDGTGFDYAYEYPWNGHIPSGVYYYTIEAEKAGKKLKKSGKMAVVR